MSNTIGITMTFNPSLSNLKDMFKNFKIDSPLRDEINKVLFRVERYAKQLAPVDTGRLRASIATSILVSELGGVVSTNVDYAIYVEDGTWKMRARPFMELAAQMVGPYMEGNLPARLETWFTNEFKSVKPEVIHL